MFAQPQQANSREVATSARAIVASPDISDNWGNSASAGRHEHDHPIIGHRLAKDYMAIHAPGQPCRYCDHPQAGRPAPGVSQPLRSADPLRRVIRAVRKRATAGAILVASVLAVAVPLGGGRALAATPSVSPSVTSATTPASHVRWHGLALINGWQPGPTRFDGTGNPRWAVSGGVVYLSGSVTLTTGADTEFAVLPPAARPSHELWINVYTLNGTSGYMSIYPTGQMYSASSPSSNANGYTSLAAISFPARSLARHKLTLRNGWQSSQGVYGTGDPSYSASHGIVYLSGSMHGGNDVDSRPFSVLPRDLRPAHFVFISVYTLDGTTGLLEVAPDGNMYAFEGYAPGFTSLAGVSFPAASIKPDKLTLRNGWKSAQHIDESGDPAYSVRQGVVYLSGSLEQPIGGSDFVTVLPRAARPAHDLYITIMVGGTDNVGTLCIEPNGTVLVYSTPPNTAQLYSSLAGISYPLNS
jgi:hypothetical protein